MGNTLTQAHGLHFFGFSGRLFGSRGFDWEARTAALLIIVMLAVGLASTSLSVIPLSLPCPSC